MKPAHRLRTAAALVVVWAVSLIPTAIPASALIREVDSYCSVTGDFCSGVYRRSNGVILFDVGGFSNYFGTLSICVTKETTACRTVEPRQVDEYYFQWKMRWQRTFPFEGFGLYRVRMTADWGHWLGGRDYRFWYTRRNAAPEHRPSPSPSPSPTASPSPSASPTP